MAGESPGMSEQRKSSGTAEERDPRLAVFREADAPADGNTVDGATAAATDKETAVFRVPRSTDADASEVASASTDGPEGATDASTPREGAPEADEAPGAATEAPGASAGTSGHASGRTEAGSGADAGSGDAADADSGTGDGSDAATGAGSGRPGDDERSGAGSGRDEGDERSASGAADAGKGRGSAAVAAEAERSDGEAAGDAEEAGDTEAAPAAASGSDARPGADADADDEPDERPEAASDSGSAADSADSAADSATDSESGSGAGEGSGPTDDRLREAVAAWVTKDPDEEEEEEAAAQDGTVARDGKASGDAGDGADTTGGKAADTDPDAAPADRAATPAGNGSKASAGTGATSESDSDSDPEADASTGPDASTGSDSDTATPAGTASGDAPRVPRTRGEAAPAKGAEPASEERGIDHPTAVFKAPRAEQLDQPTTALKLPPKEKEKGAARKPASWAAGSTDAAEAPAERTSKFVPLRSDDVRPATLVGPTVTPDVAAGPGAPGAPGAGFTEAERTRQQPMPPRPPLDLLAELTNTPPPRETPVRTAVRRVKIWTPLVLLVLVIFAIAQAVRPLPDPALTLSAAPTYTFDGEKLDMPWPEEGQGAVEVEGVGTIGSYGKEKSAPVASVAKIMTAYVILQGHPITGKENGEQIEVDAKAGDEADRPDESTAPIKEGQKYTQRQMLQLLMIPSGNNVARLLARWDATTEDAFVEKMNAAAKDLGMTNSMYTDPSGLEATTRSTPADQLKLAKAVMQNDVFREIVNMPQAEIPGIGKMIYNNNNILLEPGVSGIKTGSSTPAGGNLVWTAETVIDGTPRRIIGAVMGADVDGTLDAKLQRALRSSLKLIQAAQAGVDSATVVKKGQVVGYVDDGLGGRTPVVATKDLKAVGWGGLEVGLELTDGGTTPAHEAKAGTVVGEVTVGTGTGKVSAPVALQDDMTEPGFGDKLTRIT
ncbi:serine hydrolase [Streptomyces sp. NPDC058008]|uniref:serine hydrolase n=1 Tax=Streptomyces sp. NPDC058008 TaxID=3346303 RepID=UPI0036E192AD